MDHHVKQAPVQGVTGLWGGTQGALTSGGKADPVYIDELFSTYLWEGDSSNRTITNAIDLSGEGGSVWIKQRDGGETWAAYDTTRGATKRLQFSSTAAENTLSNGLKSFTSTGFTLGSDNTSNDNDKDYVSWSFRKKEKFFDIVTYTGNSTNNQGSNTRTISHSLGSVPGLIIAKSTSSRYWGVYHKGMNEGSNPANYRLIFNGTQAISDGQSGGYGSWYWGGTTPTDSVFTIGDVENVNANGETFIAYLFADQEDDFGVDSDAGIIKHGYYTGNGSSTTGTEIDLGWEPQWIMLKGGSQTDNWWIMDCMRGIMINGNDAIIAPNLDNVEYDDYPMVEVMASGFRIVSGALDMNVNNGKYIYTAIRRPDGTVGKPADAGTDVLAFDTAASSYPKYDAGFAPDWVFSRRPAVTESWKTMTRMTGTKKAFLDTTATWGNDNGLLWDNNTAWRGGPGDDANAYQAWMWRRHAGFDVVCYDGRQGGATVMNLKHGLGNVPEMMMIRRINNGSAWCTYHKGVNGGTNPEQYLMQLDSDNAKEDQGTFLNDTAPTSTQFTVGSMSGVNDSGDNYVNLLFSSVTGISKVGHYTGTANNNQYVNVGFACRFLMIKRSDAASQWIVFDSLRGFGNSGTNDSILEWDTQDVARNENVMNLSSSTFNPLGSDNDINADGGNYIYYAHA